MAAGVWWEWEASAAVLSFVALVLQIIGVDAKTLLRLADSKLLRLRPCSLQCAKLKRRTSRLLHLHRLYGDDGDDDDIRSTIEAATRLVDAYENSSLFQTIRSSRRMERDMSRMCRRVDDALECRLTPPPAIYVIHAPTSSTTSYPNILLPLLRNVAA